MKTIQVLHRLLPVPRAETSTTAITAGDSPPLAAGLAELYVCAVRRDSHAQAAAGRVLAEISQSGTPEGSWLWEQVRAGVTSDLARRIAEGRTS